LSELLDLSQVESGKMQLKLQSVSPLDIITKAELTVANAAKEKNIGIKTQIENNLPLIKADAEKAMWVLNNFLTNAIRYSPENGEIIVRASKVNHHVEIGVQDFGIGIDNSFQNKIFDRFFRVPGVKEKKGTGLGLAISKDMVEGMEGEIGLRSELGKGSYFFGRFKIDS
jgi:signal transduction histidine kinase